MTRLEETVEEGRKIIIDEALYDEFQQRYGALGAHLIIFHAQFKQYGDDFVRDRYAMTTYYRHRHLLVMDGYLSLDEFKSKG